MFKIIGIESAKFYNFIRITYLFLLIPIILFILLYITIVIVRFFDLDVLFLNVFTKNFTSVRFSLFSEGVSDLYYTVIATFCLLILILLLLKYIFGKNENRVFSITKSRIISRKECIGLYNIVENLAITRGISIPRIGIMESDNINSFSIGWNNKKTTIVFTRGAIEKLNIKEIEAMASHEISHIFNGDTKAMVLVYFLTKPVENIGKHLIGGGIFYSRFKYKNNKDFRLVLLTIMTVIIGLPYYILGTIILSAVSIGFSRKKEYLADIGSIELLKNKEFLISAIEKSYNLNKRTYDSISEHSYLSSIFFSNPERSLTFFESLLPGFPSLEKRLKMINSYYE